ncbi:MAG TPA: rubrerythrin [Candidatus Acetothermia bacterium]|nr:ferritin family protein [Candidatus Bipolaricaulota bacterium]HDO74719.1 rubrerythrin [Candidatus Acetothermia bacterium]HEX32661.1 rubrerythrin [Candidatus Acetothermia bacterium]
MNRSYNIDEILAMAERIERNGAEYYERAAELTEDEGKKAKLRKLADMERSHEKTFADMRASQPEEQASFDPDGEAGRYLGAIVDGNVFDYRSAPAADLAGKSLVDIYRKAIDLEKDSIIFYLGIRELVPEKLGNAQMDDIIREEMGHIVLLSDDLAVELEK